MRRTDVVGGLWRSAVVAAACASTALGAQAPSPSGGQILVSPNGAVRTITEAVRLAQPGAHVIVTRGVYREPTIVIDKPLTMEGRGWPTIDGEDQRALMIVRADDVTVRGMRFTRVGVAMTEDRAALRVTSAARCRIEGNRFDDTFFGVYLAKVDGCVVQGNTFAGTARGSESTSGNAIHLWSARNVDILGNRITGHRDGIYFEFVRLGRVAANVSEGNLRYGLHFMYSDSCRYENNTFRDNHAGVAVMYTNTVSMTNNFFTDSRGAAAYGLLLKEIGDPTLRGNVFARNTVALMADGVTRLLAEDNTFRDNGWAFRLMSNTQDTRVVRNDFVGNTFDVTSNGQGGDGLLFMGNHFADYRGYDLDRNGRGDVPHRPVRLLSLLVERHESALLLQRSFFVGLLDAAERVIPSLTPARLVDSTPSMRRVARSGRGAPVSLLQERH